MPIILLFDEVDSLRNVENPPCRQKVPLPRFFFYVAHAHSAGLFRKSLQAQVMYAYDTENFVKESATS